MLLRTAIQIHCYAPNNLNQKYSASFHPIIKNRPSFDRVYSWQKVSHPPLKFRNEVIHH